MKDNSTKTASLSLFGS